MFEKLMTTISEIIDRIEKEGSQTQEVILDELGKIYDDEAAERLNQIRGFLVRTDDNHREIVEGKSDGRSSDAWLRGRLASKEQNFPGITRGIIQGFQDLSGSSDVSGQKQILALDEENPFDFKIMSQNIKKIVAASTLSGVTTIDDTMGIILEKSLSKPYAGLNDALKSDMNSEEDRKMKELLTVGALKFVYEAGEKSILKKLDHVRTTAIVDAAYTTSKIAYKVANDSMRSEDAVEFIVDRGLARFESVVHSTCMKVGQRVGTTIGRTIGAVFGPAGVAVGGMVGGVIGSLAGKKVASVMSDGIKKVVNRVANKAIDVGNSIMNGIKQLFS
ncbi:hypothetical protein SZL87_14985 [Exiguobacterium indicum]|uniref:Glycine zipper domain-containing protein n=1 Tax=Exiguobacterium indicum TaxID=296995 RepID=A0ABU8ELC4_9BACL